MSQRRKYSPEFKREAVELARQSGVSIRLVADEVGISAGNLACWKRELARVKKERDFLAKTATFFAKESS